MPSPFIIQGQVRGSSGSAGSALASNGTFWTATPPTTTAKKGIAQSAWTDGQIIRILNPPDRFAPVLSAQDFGCVDDCAVTGALLPATDNWAALQLGIDSYKGKTVILPVTNTGCYALSKPLMFSPAVQGAVALTGENGWQGQNTLLQTTLRPQALSSQVLSYLGPAIFVTANEDPTISNSLGPNMYDSTPVGFGMPNLNLMENGTGVIGGLSALTVECFVYVPSVGFSPGNPLPLVQSQGVQWSGQTTAVSMSMQVDTTSGNHLRVVLNTTGGQVANGLLSSTAFPMDQLVHIALSWDGSTLKTFVNGTQDAALTHACTGTIVQQWYEDFTLGVVWSRWPMAGVLIQAPNGTKFGSLRVCREAVYTANFTAPTSDLSIIPGRMTIALYNFGPSSLSKNNTQTVANPNGHQGAVIGLSNYTVEYGGIVWPDAGIPVWLPWHSGNALGVTNFRFERLAFANFSTGLYLQFAQGCLIKDCGFGSCTRSVTISDFSYETTLDHCTFIGGNGDLSHNWLIGVRSEIVVARDCGGNGAQWSFVASGSVSNTLRFEGRNYFDAGAIGGLYANGLYSLSLNGCHFYQETAPVSECIVRVINVNTCTTDGGAFSCAGAPFVWEIIGTTTGNPFSQGYHSYNSHFTTQGNSNPIFSFKGSNYTNKVRLLGYTPDAMGSPATPVAPLIDPSGVGPLDLPHLGQYTYNFTAAGPLSYPSNLFWYPTWHFTDTGAHLVAPTTVNIPYNVRDKTVLIWNQTSQTLNFVGPDGGTPVAITAGSRGRIYCTDTYIGTGGFTGTWISA